MTEGRLLREVGYSLQILRKMSPNCLNKSSGRLTIHPCLRQSHPLVYKSCLEFCLNSLKSQTASTLDQIQEVLSLNPQRKEGFPHLLSENNGHFHSSPLLPFPLVL